VNEIERKIITPATLRVDADGDIRIEGNAAIVATGAKARILIREGNHVAVENPLGGSLWAASIDDLADALVRLEKLEDAIGRVRTAVESEDGEGS